MYSEIDKYRNGIQRLENSQCQQIVKVPRIEDFSQSNDIIYASIYEGNRESIEWIDEHEELCPAEARYRGLQKKPYANKLLNRDIDRIREHFDATKAIWHLSLSMPGLYCINNVDEYQRACKKAIKRLGISKAVLFGVDVGYDGHPHIHALVQGHITPWRAFYFRTGWSYHKFGDDRKEFIRLDGNQLKHMTGFKSTCKYLLEKDYRNKKRYIKV